MDVKATIKPGESGSKKYLRQYGDRLVCVRHRIDKTRGKRLTTVELIVEEQDHFSESGHSYCALKPLRIGFSENELRETMKQAGAFWDGKRKVWLLQHGKILELGLEDRIVNEIEYLRNHTGPENGSR